MDLRQLLLGEKKRVGFISVARLVELVTAESVAARLAFRGFHYDSPAVSVIVSTARKLFAILVLLELEHHAPTLIRSGKSDSIFPIDETDIPPFETQHHRQAFFSEQWIIPPCFDRDKHLEFSGATVLPFLEKERANNGTFGVLYKVRLADGHLEGYSSDSILALKITSTQDDNFDVLMREANTLRERQHAHIVPLLASFTVNTLESGYETKHLNMLFPYADMDMEQWMNLTGPPPFLRDQSRAAQRKYLYQTIYDLLSAIAFLHREISGMVTSHHDLKPRNIIVVGNKLMICDLGRAHSQFLERGSETEGKSGLGTYTYHPPEYWNDDGLRATGSHGRAFDIWAMACIILEISILIVYGWEAQKIRSFRNDRLMLPDTERRFPSNGKGRGADDSFHNSIPVVDAWLRLLEEDGSLMMKQTLTVAVGMLRQTPGDRLHSWEAMLDMYEILNSDIPNAELLREITANVERPPPKELTGCSTPLHRTSSRGNLNRVIALLKAGWKPDVRDDGGNLPFDLAHCNGYHTVCCVLSRVDKNSLLSQTVHVGGHTPKQLSISDIYIRERNGFRVREHTVSANIIGNGCEASSAISKSPAIAETSNLSSNILRRGFGADRSVVHITARDNDINTMRELLTHSNAELAVQMEDYFGRTPLHYASESASPDMVAMILQASPTPHLLVMAEDRDGRTPLHLAVFAKREEIVDPLLRAGRDKALMIRKEDAAGETPLHLAQERRYLSVENLLRKAEIEAKLDALKSG